MRTNKYKSQILEILKKNHLLSIADIHKKISGADYSTIYRNIEQLVSLGEIKKIVLDKDNVAYEIEDKNNQHDHFVCTNCGFVDEVGKLPSKIKSLGNHLVTEVLLRGVCGKCH